MNKSATKVLAPPGGKTSINLFSYQAENQSRPINKCQAARSRSQVFPGYEPCHEEAQENEEKQLRKQLDRMNIESDEAADHPNRYSNGHAIEPNGEEENHLNHEKINGECTQEQTVEADTEDSTEDSDNDKDKVGTEKAVNVCQMERNKSSVFATEGEEEKKSQRKFSPPIQKPTEDRPKTATRVLSPPGGVTSISLFGDGDRNTSSTAMDGNNNRGRQKNGDYRSSSFDHVFGGGNEGQNDDAHGRRRGYTPRSSNNIFG